MKNRLMVALLSSSSLLAGTAVLAQSTETTTLETITVSGGDETPVGPDATIVAKTSRTASKTSTPLVDTPASVSVVTEKELEERGVTTLDEALSYTPGVVTDVYGSDNRYDHYMIRGFYSTGLSTFRDGLPLRVSNFTGSRMEPYGLQRLEVLKGANSTLFGLSQPGGIVNAVSKRPLDYKFGEIYTTFGEDHLETGADIGGPIDAEGLWSYRLTGKWQDARQGIDFSQDDRIYIAPALTFSPSADTDFTILSSYNKRNGSTSHGIPYGSGIDSETYLAEPDYDNMDTEEWNIGYEFRHDFGNGLEFRQNARYTHLELLYEGVYAGGSGVEAGRSALGIDGTADRFGIDNQLQYDASFGAFDSTMLLGVSYDHEDVREVRLDGYLDGIDINNPVYVGRDAITFYPAAVTDSTQKTASAYLQEQLTLNDQWILTLGGRYDHVDTVSEGTYGDNAATDAAFTSRAGLTYKATDEVSLFANYAESFQPMDANRSLLVGEAKPQKGTQYEVGAKYQPAGMDALFSVALFDLTQTNVAQYTPDYSAQYQIGEINVRGLELEGKVAMTNRINLTAAYSYWDAEIKDDTTPVNVGKRPQLVPAHMASLWGDYTIPGNGRFGDVTLGLGARFVGEVFADYANTIELPSRIVFDAALNYQVSENVALAVNATNLFDKEYVSSVDTYSNTAYYGDRRAVKATLRYTW
ncbi:TonB-dependent siderophore receptor [Hoeflea marina]|uniref:TonB-dependent siderophore receptor n=1 Tax=Hoeflea marina TaxID=274592 RepID=UPI001FE10668|nr:TonB-dependent siderophore receptor [Hoeflea marina]